MQWFHFLYHWHHVMPTKVPVLHLILVILTKQKYWHHWWCHWHHMMLVMLMVSHDQKSCIASPFGHLDLTNGMVPLMTVLALCDTDTTINGITWPKKLCCISFSLSWLKKWSSDIDDAIVITWYWPKMSCCMSFSTSKPNKSNDVFDDTVSIM